MLRNSLKYVSWKDRRTIAKDLRTIYTAATAEKASAHLEQFADTGIEKYASISILWRRHWDDLTPFFAFPADIREVIYTTNAIETMNRGLRKIIKTRGAFHAEHPHLTGPCASYYTWPCRIYRRNGPDPSIIGRPPSTGSSSCTRNVRQSPETATYTELWTDPWNRVRNITFTS